MGAHICEYGTKHRMCRCPEVHHIVCPEPEKCQAEQYEPKHRKEDS